MGHAHVLKDMVAYSPAKEISGTSSLSQHFRSAPMPTSHRPRLGPALSLMHSAGELEKLQRVQALLQRTLAATQTSIHLSRDLMRAQTVGVLPASSRQFDAFAECTTQQAANSRFTEDDDEKELFMDLFIALGANKRGNHLTRRDQGGGFSGHEEEVLESLLKSNRSGQAHEQSASLPPKVGVNFREFSELLEKLPRVRGERVKWARSLWLEEVLARHVPKCDIFDGLKGIRTLTESQQRALAERLTAEEQSQPDPREAERALAVRQRTFIRGAQAHQFQVLP
jgi:hypothetical protein